jgi:signal transduction histidine kinase
LVLEPIWLLFWDPGPPGSVLLTWPNADVADAIDAAQRLALGVGSFALTAVLGARWLRASPPLRRRLTPILAGAVTLLVSAVNLLVAKLTDGLPSDAVQTCVLAALIAVPLGVLVDILRARLARLAVGDLVLELSRDRDPEHLRAALAHALGDPSLRVAYWLPEFETYADLEGRPLELPEDERRVTRMVERSGAPVAALVHDPTLRDEPALLDSVGAAAGIALENARLQAELRAAGTRVLEATQSERRRLERDLHDGAQQRLVALSLELGMLEARLAADPAARSAVVQVRRELTQSLEELRELARGIHPAILSGHGLEVALEGLAARAPVPVRLTVELDGRLSEAVEVATYFLVSESLTNVAKYAQASTASVDVVRANGDVVIDVVDDGVGGADPAGGSGLRGLSDRVEALGGRLRVTSPSGDGTRLHAEIPCG